MFVSLYFVIFMAVLWLLYCVLPHSWRAGLLLIFSYIFCGFISVGALVVLIISTLIVFWGAKAVEKSRKTGGKPGLIAGLTGGLFAFVLIIFKNIPYVIKMFNMSFVPESSFLRSVLLPVGFSFYAFSAIGYIYDVYREKETAEKNLLNFALFMSFFGKLVSGPIERKGQFVPQIEKLSQVKVWDRERLIKASTYIAWGYFLKMVIADRLALIVDEVVAGHEMYDTVWLVLTAVFYSFQIYMDFAGYTCIAIGVALALGIELTQNFDSPYVAVNITEFWRRWHISLSTWLRDYLYIPLGGNRKGKARKCLNTLIVFLVCGIWHGNGLSFVVWGLLHGIYSIFDSVVGKKVAAGDKKAAAGPKNEDGDESFGDNEDGGASFGDRVIVFLRRCLTFAAVTFAWIFFRAESLTLAFSYIGKMFTGGFNPKGCIGVFESNGGIMIQVYLSLALIILIQVVDVIGYRRKCPFPVMVTKWNRTARYLFYYCIIIGIFIFGIYGGEFKTENFIYMQF